MGTVMIVSRGLLGRFLKLCYFKNFKDKIGSSILLML